MIVRLSLRQRLRLAGAVLVVALPNRLAFGTGLVLVEHQLLSLRRARSIPLPASEVVTHHSDRSYLRRQRVLVVDLESKAFDLRPRKVSDCSSGQAESSVPEAER